MAAPPFVMPGLTGEYMKKEAVIDFPEDERAWVPRPGGGLFAPRLLDTNSGMIANLYRYTQPGILGKHIHSSPVFAYTIKGQWRYLEHDWVAKPGSFVWEVPGEVHTLVVDEAEVLGFYVWSAGYTLVDDAGNPTKVETVISLLEYCDAHYRKVGLGADYIKQFVR